jgi:23S rRNA U2552 (ribose-2'-O)-methylase RlmE/FtsJ
VKLLAHNKRGLQADLIEKAGSDKPTASMTAAAAQPASTSERLVDVVVSDIAPNLSGIADTDAARIELLIELAVDFSKSQLKPEGALVVKLFHGGVESVVVSSCYTLYFR